MLDASATANVRTASTLCLDMAVALNVPFSFPSVRFSFRMCLLGRSIHVRGKGSAHDLARDFSPINVPFLSECGRRHMKGDSHDRP